MQELNIQTIMLNMELSEMDEHALRLGKLIGNFQSLEFILRAFLSQKELATLSSPSKSGNLYELHEGDFVPENTMTDWKPLGALIRKYNNNAKIRANDLNVDESLVKIRDAIAHGRVSSASLSTPLQLLKFSKPCNKIVRVEFSVLMTKQWLNEQVSRVAKAVSKVKGACDRLERGEL